MALLGLTLRFLLSLFLWPLAAALAWAFARQAWGLPWTQGYLPWFAGGAALYLLVQLVFYRPLFLYVMGHELTHALAAWLQGGQADELHVSSRGGKVKVSRSNFLVSLAPYFFPIYTAAACLVFLVARDGARPALAGLVGLSLAFHCALTVYSLRQHQSDLAEVGWFFALPFILALNLLLAGLVLGLLSPPQSSFGLLSLLGGAWEAARAGAAWARLSL